MEVYKFKVKRLGKMKEVEVRFGACAFPMDMDYQEGTACILKIGSEIYTGIALQHPNEKPDTWKGRQISFDRAVDALISTAPKNVQKQAKTALWNCFMSEVHKEQKAIQEKAYWEDGLSDTWDDQIYLGELSADWLTFKGLPK